ncbi:GntR family transcriptional regulator [Saccharopolyspora phatthalungensis]|uniref:DNA-binding GntR family transcriptional regulator n=1 Tax=Saccharopolyspora phatthalungensis TaxID=664693 RepID=A0A840QH01_9PSEU|nr:GntR family transcriptional regulator [Saccharopolyspora phatthalungensis]MBB5156483.1 DNA-binding GntR family transcriptional regulator [Saccharopolyspora phatthalungensis]
MGRAEKEQLRSNVASAIRDQIMARTVHPGDTLRLGQLAEELGVSITPVREALLLLSQDGWVRHEPNRGFRVAPIRRKDVEDTYLMWSTAEGEIAARAATRATSRDVAYLREIDQRIRDADPSDGHLATELNSALHHYVSVIADAPKLNWFAQAASRLVPLQFPENFHVVPGWSEVNRTQHTPLIDAIAAGDVEAARSGTAAHFQGTGNLLIQWLDSLEFWSEPETPQAPRGTGRLAG